MATKPGLTQRFEMYRPSKAALGWACVLCIIGTMVVGFNWGGWVTGGTATEMTNKAADAASAKLAAAMCAAQFNRAPDVTVQLAALKKLDTWQRSDFVKQGGWASLPGLKEPVTGSAELCARQLTDSTL